MKATRLSLAALLSCSLFATSAYGQTLKQPTSVRPASHTYDYYYTDQEDPSPSDAPAAPTVPGETAKPMQAPTQAKDYFSDGWDGCLDGCDGKGGCDSCCGTCFLFGDGEAFKVFDNPCSSLDIGMWTQVGYFTSGANGNGTGLFNDYPNRVQLQQQWLYVEKATNTDCQSFDWGFRVDGLYGTDGPDTQAFGGRPNEWDFGWNHGGAYGFAIPQAYVELAYDKLSAKVGHFYTTIGYEVVMAPHNFFYSHAFTQYRAEPFTHGGILFEYDMADDITLYGGWTAGWDTAFSRNGGSNFLGGISLQVTDNVNFIYGTTMGDFGFDTPAGAGSDNNGYEHSIIVDWTFRDNWNYVFQTDYIDNDIFLRDTQDLVTFVNYLLYEWNDCVGLGARLEWFKDPRIGLGAAGEITALTVGANIRPHANLVFRPEVRWDDYNAASGLQDSTVFGIDGILTY
jgi:hypothetical protein